MGGAFRSGSDGGVCVGPGMSGAPEIVLPSCFTFWKVSWLVAEIRPALCFLKFQRFLRLLKNAFVDLRALKMGGQHRVQDWSKIVFVDLGGLKKRKKKKTRKE